MPPIYAPQILRVHDFGKREEHEEKERRTISRDGSEAACGSGEADAAAALVLESSRWRHAREVI
jgi:hypothetical protein